MKHELIRKLVREVLKEMCKEESEVAEDVDARYAAKTIPAPPPESEDELIKRAAARNAKRKASHYKPMHPADDTPTIRPPKF